MTPHVIESQAQASRLLRAGSLIAFPTETVYGLGVDAENESAVARMFEVKGRPAKHPVIVHISDQNLVSYWAEEIPEYAIALMRKFWPGPITLILKRSGNAKDFITGGQEFVGLRIPSNPIALKLLSEFESLGGHGVAAPSANRFGSVSPTSAKDVVEEIGELLGDDDLIIDGGASEVGVESTIIDCSRELPRILRLGAVTEAMIETITPIDTDSNLEEIRVSGSLTRHYSPRAKVIIDREAKPGEGLIALSDIPTPDGAVRLTAPDSVNDYARSLYSALRKGDSAGLGVIVVNPPRGEGLADAIRDRILRASAH
ncbi:MAG: threonylcarbamoyl-AMP synthase [Actinobacteria bacterium]|nr:threonylcarbamoyl-AMP synthase [Actinomycetota bacterium]